MKPGRYAARTGPGPAAPESTMPPLNMTIAIWAAAWAACGGRP
jgi:hypothetical protein